MRNLLIFLFPVLPLLMFCSNDSLSDLKEYNGDAKGIHYTGRFDFSNPDEPKCWSPGAYFEFQFSGTTCVIELKDENKYGQYHNYIAVVVDGGLPKRIRLDYRNNRIVVAENLGNGKHTVLICKNTESNVGYIQLTKIYCKQLLETEREKKNMIEFIGDSITCGNGSDTSEMKCGVGKWYDQHNAYLSYGPLSARAMHSDYLLSSFSGIGLAQSCCDIPFRMKDIYKTLELMEGGTSWNLKLYTPDIQCITLGQNDGFENSEKYVAAYLNFVEELRSIHPNTKIVCCSSPMAGDELKQYHERIIPGIVYQLKQRGYKEVYSFLYQGQYRKGCGNHPLIAEHELISKELTTFLSEILSK